MEKVIKNQNELQEIADYLVELITQNKNTKALVIALKGDLGSGKTTLTKLCAEKMNVKEHVASPTFVIERIYPVEIGRFKNFIHIDAYRMKDHKDIEQLGWNEQVSNPENLIFIEWPEIVKDSIPSYAVMVEISHGASEEERVIIIKE